MSPEEASETSAKLMHEAAQRVVDQAPPLDDAMRERLRVLLNGDGLVEEVGDDQGDVDQHGAGEGHAA